MDPNSPPACPSQAVSPGCLCQPMVIGANSTPSGIPNLGCSEAGNLIRCKQLNWDPTPQHDYGTAQLCYNPIMKQQVCEVALQPGPSRVRQLCLTQPALYHSSPAIHDTPLVFQPLCFSCSGRNSFRLKGNMHSSYHRGADLCRQKVLPWS